MTGFSVYRFGDSVAVSGPGPTHYMTARDARALARALNRAARSVILERFTDSHVGTFKAPALPHGNHRAFTLERDATGRAILKRGKP